MDALAWGMGTGLLLLAGCASQPEEPSWCDLDFPPGSVYGAHHERHGAWRAVPPLDTLALIGSVGIRDSAAIPPLAPGSLDERWVMEEDTIIVSFSLYACTCPDHHVIDTTKSGGIPVFYIHPAVPELEIPWRAQCAGNLYKLIGHRSKGIWRPPQTMGPPDPGYHFRYRSYAIVRPYRLWGPHVLGNDWKNELKAAMVDPVVDGNDPWDAIWGPAANLTVE